MKEKESSKVERDKLQKELQTLIANSTCFGVAYSDKVKECKICQVHELCKEKTLDGPGAPDNEYLNDNLKSDKVVNIFDKKKKASASEEKPSKPEKKKPKVKSSYDFKSMNITEIEEVAGLVEVDYKAIKKKFKEDKKAYRMKLIMTIKSKLPK